VYLTDLLILDVVFTLLHFLKLHPPLPPQQANKHPTLISCIWLKISKGRHFPCTTSHLLHSTRVNQAKAQGL
jgi:hypothetical protein